jgi:enoyl-[acyl-carrier-protein] reductase (NADH)
MNRKQEPQNRKQNSGSRHLKTENRKQEIQKVQKIIQKGQLKIEQSQEKMTKNLQEKILKDELITQKLAWSNQEKLKTIYTNFTHRKYTVAILLNSIIYC